jgi:hypothetical protein
MRAQFLVSAMLLAVGASGTNLVTDADFEGGFSGFSTSWNPHLTPGFPNDLGVSTALAGDNPNTGSWFAWFADGIPLTS